jgi:hypothetical protein
MLLRYLHLIVLAIVLLSSSSFSSEIENSKGVISLIDNAINSYGIRKGSKYNGRLKENLKDKAKSSSFRRSSHEEYELDIPVSTAAPTEESTTPPTASPSEEMPSDSPTNSPTEEYPSYTPSASPTEAENVPTYSPTEELPTWSPTPAPSEEMGSPTHLPTEEAPTDSPSPRPTVPGETNPPSSAPTNPPSSAPTQPGDTNPPSSRPTTPGDTNPPSSNPTAMPSYPPTSIPSNEPSANPTPSFTHPTSFPSVSLTPTTSPSPQPTVSPSATPSAVPTFTRSPTFENPPTANPTIRPTPTPTASPTFAASPYVELIYNITQVFSAGVSASDFLTDPSAISAFESVVEQIFDPQNINTAQVNGASGGARRRLLVDTSSPALNVNYYAIFHVSQNNANATAVALQANLTTQMNYSVTTGQFTTLLQQSGSATLSTFVSDVVPVIPAAIVIYQNAQSSGSDEKKGLTDGEVAGITIGCVAFVAIVAALIAYQHEIRRSLPIFKTADATTTTAPGAPGKDRASFGDDLNYNMNDDFRARESVEKFQNPAFGDRRASAARAASPRRESRPFVPPATAYVSGHGRDLEKQKRQQEEDDDNPFTRKSFGLKNSDL